MKIILIYVDSSTIAVDNDNQMQMRLIINWLNKAGLFLTNCLYILFRIVGRWSYREHITAAQYWR